MSLKEHIVWLPLAILCIVAILVIWVAVIPHAIAGALAVLWLLVLILLPIIFFGAIFLACLKYLSKKE